MSRMASPASTSTSPIILNQNDRRHTTFWSQSDGHWMVWTTLVMFTLKKPKQKKRETMEVLSRKLEDTHDEIQRVRYEVAEALKAFYGGTSSLSAEEALAIAARWSTPAQHPVLTKAATANGVASEMDERMGRLAKVLQDVVSQLQLDDSGPGDGAPTRLISSFAQRERLKRQMEQSRRMLQVVENVTHLDNELFEVDARMNKGDVVGAAEATVRAQSLFSELQNPMTPDAVDGEDVVRVLQLQLLKKKNRLLHTLDQAHKKMISTRPTALRVKKPSFGVSATSPGVPRVEAYRMLWRASDLMDIRAARLNELAKTVSQHLFKPLFNSDRAFVKMSEEADGVCMAVLSPDEVMTPKRSEVDTIEQKSAQIVAILRFVHAEMLAADVETMRSAAELLWKSPGNLESQLLTVLQDKIPKETSAINAYRDAIMRVVDGLSEAAESLGFTIPKNSQVRNFGDQINLLYAKKRRQQLLTIARGFMGRDYRNSTKVTAATERCNIDASIGSGKKDGGSKGKMISGGTSSLGIGSTGDEVESGTFQMPDYRITHCAHDVVELAHQTLMEACTPDSVCANTFFHTSRDVLFLFRAVVPTLYQNEIANDASTCMLFHNDCMYIAHHMLTIGHLYKSRLPSPLNQIATMVDMVPAFRETGENALTTYAKAMSDDLRNGVRTFQERGGVESSEALEDLEQFLKSALYKLNHIMTSWREGLPQPVYNRVMHIILQPLAASYLEQMLLDKKIGASTTGKLHNLTSLLLETQALFASIAQAEKHVPELVKLRRFASLLVQPLATIEDQFLDGSLSDFTPQELSAAIRSLFRESRERKELLRLISSLKPTEKH